jgi:hypothetical protein
VLALLFFGTLSFLNLKVEFKRDKLDLRGQKATEWEAVKILDSCFDAISSALRAFTDLYKRGSYLGFTVYVNYAELV